MSDDTGNEFSDDRNDTKTIYGLPNQNKLRLNKSVIWIPIVIGMSVATGILTTRAIQRLSRGAHARASASVRASQATSESASTTAASTESASTVSSGPSWELPETAETDLTAKTFTGFVPHTGDFREPMDVGEAALILGCRETSSKEVMNKRFNMLMKCNHPDKGGSPFLATKINEAKQVLQKGK
eukprot:156947_1